MSDITNLEKIADIYDVQGTGIQNNIRGGDFYINDGHTSAGVATGNVISFAEYIYPVKTMISNFTLQPGFATVIPLTQVAANTQWTIGYFNNEKVLLLPNVTTFIFETEDPQPQVSVQVSGYDRYNQKSTYIDLSKPKAFSKLTSMILTNLKNTSVDITITTAVCFEFPYYNFGQNRYLIMPRLSNSDTSSYSLFVAKNPVSGTPSFPADYIQWGGQLKRPTKDPFNTEDYTTRPLLFIDDEELQTAVNTSTRTLITGRQIVFGTGNNLPTFITPEQIPKYLNAPEVVYGGTPSASGWTGWQG